VSAPARDEKPRPRRRRRGSPTDLPIPERHPHRREIQAERDGWYELLALVRPLTLRERIAPGYYHDPDWSIRDVVGHIGTWMAEAQVQLARIGVGTYEGHEIDIDALNAVFLEAMRDQPWEVAWVQATAGRSMMLKAWYGLAEPSEEAAWWIRKSAAEHYGEHLGRLREWTAELIGRRRAKAQEPAAQR
jgi:hypothetical protein